MQFQGRSKDMFRNRRDFLKYLGAATAVASSPVELLIDQLALNIVHKASASEELTNKYILLQQYAAPPRWMYDLFLSPYGKNPLSSVMKNGSVVSEFTATGGRYTGGKYNTHKVRGINAPLIWTHDVSDASGAAIPMSDLMDHMLVLQGVDALNPGHQPAAGLMNRPLTHYSIDGVLADKSKQPFGALAFGSTYLSFKSKTGKSIKRYGRTEKFDQVLQDAFKAGLGDVHVRYAEKIDQAAAKINRDMASVKLGAGSIGVDQKSAKKLMLGEIKKISTAYPKLVTKYKKIIDQTVNMSKSLKGLTDKPIGKTFSRTEPNKDLAYRLTRGDIIIEDADLRETLNGATIRNLAEQMAVTEYVITNDLTSTASLGVGELVARVNNRLIGIANDQHRTGIIPQILYSTVYFRIISACVLALIEALKETPYKDSNMFNHTVIRVASEFGRHPRTDGTGSDHSPWSSNCSIYSGMIKGPIIAGQIVKDGSVKGRRAGSFGVAGSLKHGPTATTGHVISSIAAMLDIPSPSTNNPSLVVKNEDGSVILNEHYIAKTEVVES